MLSHGFLSVLLRVSSQFGVHLHPIGSRVLLGGLYLFTAYALQWATAFRYLPPYLGIPIAMP